jgi:hypothetical protein
MFVENDDVAFATSGRDGNRECCGTNAGVREVEGLSLQLLTSGTFSTVDCRCKYMPSWGWPFFFAIWT